VQHAESPTNDAHGGPLAKAGLLPTSICVEEDRPDDRPDSKVFNSNKVPLTPRLDLKSVLSFCCD